MTFEHKGAYACSFDNALPRSQALCILAPTTTNLCSVIPPVLSENILPSHPRRIRNINQTELLPSKVWPFDLHRELSLRIVQFPARSVLLFLALCLEETLPRRNDCLGRVVDPQARLGALEWIGGEETRFVVRVRILEELAQDDRFVKSFALVLDCGDEALGIDICLRGEFYVTEARVVDDVPRKCFSFLYGFTSLYWYGMPFSSKEIQTRWLKGQNCRSGRDVRLLT